MDPLWLSGGLAARKAGWSITREFGSTAAAASPIQRNTCHDLRTFPLRRRLGANAHRQPTCRHCASAAGLPRPDELTTEEALALCDQFPSLAVQEVDFTGGDPLLRPDWWRIARRVAELGIATRIVTNGLPLVASTVARIREVGISTVGVSLDGLEATHDDIRALPGLWRRVLAGIERAVSGHRPRNAARGNGQPARRPVRLRLPPGRLAM
jgi:pyruvate-formate lyase-activating enzyme